MSIRWKYLLLACLPLLPGCLQIELVGPVTGARISITPLRGGAPLANGLVSSGVQQAQEALGDTPWAELDETVKAAFLGLVEIPELELANNQYYLVTATGGVDKDANGDRRVDARGVTVERSVHAIMSGTQLKQPFNRVTMLSDAIYRVLEPELAKLSNAELGNRLNTLARKAVGDVNRDSLLNYKDVLSWSYFSGREQYKGDPVFLERLPRAITSTVYGEDIADLDSLNALESASLAPAQANPRWNKQIVGCLYPVVYGDLCSMRVLPLVGMEEESPDVSNIMARLVVSHPWIRGRFEQVLKNMPNDILLMFRSVTAVIVGTEIRPSFYDALTGALYLDAEYFWLSPEERKAVSTEADFRTEFASTVNFADFWRYVDNGANAFESLYAADDLGQRQLADIELVVASLLLHELAHAADAFRPDFIELIPESAALYQVEFAAVSDELQGFRPLLSDKLASIASVLYYGVMPTAEETTYTGAQVGAMFAPDRASDLYGYTSQYEDTAMLFEEAMMQVLYGVQRDVAFTSVPEGGPADDISCADYKVGWGMRGRIATARILERAEFVMSSLLPERNYSLQLRQLPQPTLFKTGKDWCESLVIDGDSNRASIQSVKSARAPGRYNIRRFR